MTSGESFNKNAVEADGVVIEILNPNLIVLPIPENRLGANNTVELGISITNNTSTRFRLNPYEIFIPELVALDGQALQRHLSLEGYETRENNYLLVPPREAKSFFISVMLVWENNLLKLKVSNLAEEFDFTSYCFFYRLDSGSYRLRFIYNKDCGNEPSSDLDTGNMQKIESGQLASPFVSLRLVQPIEANCSAVEVDGIRFETIVPEQMLNIPKKNLMLKLLHFLKMLLLPEPYPLRASVQLGIRITNNTYKPVRFNFFLALIPELMRANGQIPFEGGWIRPAPPLESYFPSINPGESITFFPAAEFFSIWGNQFGLSIATGISGRLIFQNLKLEAYKFRFIYNNSDAVATTYSSEITDTKLIGGIWTGMVITPWMDFSLVHI